MRSAGSWALVMLGAFVVLLVSSALAYPGGSWADRQAERFHWVWNYWCDLIRRESLNGAPNGTSRRLAQLAFVSLATSLALFWRAVVPLVRGPRQAQAMLVMGTLSAIGVVLVGLLPHNEWSRLHALGTLTGGGFGLVAVALLLAGSLATGPLVCWRHAWGALLLLAALINLAAYIDAAFVRPRDGPLLPVAQKLATPLLLLWMIASVRDARRVGLSRGRTRPASS